MSLLNLNCRNIIATGALALVAAFAPFNAARAEDPITLVLPYGAGGLLDGLVRQMSETMTEELGAPVVVENKPGANGIVGATYAAAAKPDGLTYFVGATGPLSLNVLLRENLPYSMDSFEPVATMLSGPLSITVPASMGVNSLEELKVWAENSDKPLRYAMLGPGSVSHLYGMVLQEALDVELVPVAYKSNAPILIDQVGGLIDLNFSTPISLVKHVESGDLKILAISTDVRMSRFPDLPTVTELGYPELVSSFWFGLLAPAGTPQAEKDRVSAALQVAMSRSDLQDRMISVGLTPHVGGADAMQAQLDWDVNFWGSVISEHNIVLE